MADERLATAQGFRRFVGRVTPWAYRWLVRLCVPDRDRDDVVQETLIAAYQRRDSYDPDRGNWNQWAFGFLVLTVKNYRKRTARRIKRVDVPRGDLPEMVSSAPGPDEEADQAMMRDMLARCLEGIPDDARALLHAKAEGIPMREIAEALGVAESTAYVYLRDAEQRVQEALDREQAAKRARGVAVLPVTVGQLFASEGPPPDVPAETMEGVWKALDRAMADDLKSGKLRDDGTAEPRYMGRPGATPRARVLRALTDPRVTHALTAVAGALGGALVVYQIMRGLPARSDIEPRSVANVVASGSPTPGPSSSEASVTNAPPEAPGLAPEAGDAGAPTRPTASAGPAESGQTLIERAMSAYGGHHYGDAIAAFEEHARRYPRDPFAGTRERLLTLSLIGAGRKAEARRRIEAIRRADPQSPSLGELDRALSGAN